MRVLIFTATYNEAGNIEDLINEIWLNQPAAEILVVDDNSPDGTGAILQRIAAKNPGLHNIFRPGKMGVGSAHRLAFEYARKNGYDLLITMDADFSHDPKVIPRFVAESASADFVIGSRFVDGGKLDYTGFRRLISRGANLIARYALGVVPRETTTSYRCYNRQMLSSFPIHLVLAEGYSFFLECTYIISHMGVRLREIPIHFEERRAGKSKISKKEIINGLLTVARLLWDRLARVLRIRKPISSFC